MKKILILVSLTVFSFSNAIAVTLYDALNQTYQNNIQLNAERENIKASEEDINISKADYKPTITLSGSKSLENTNKLTNQSGGDATINDVDPFTTSISPPQCHPSRVWFQEDSQICICLNFYFIFPNNFYKCYSCFIELS